MDQTDERHTADEQPSCGELILSHLEHLHSLWLDGLFPLSGSELNLTQVLADSSFRDRLFAGLVAYTSRDRSGTNYHLHSREVLRLEADARSPTRFPWRCLTYPAFSREGLDVASAAFASEHARRLPTHWPNDPLRDVDE